MTIQDILNKLSSELLMKNMRQHIVDGLEQVYKDATAKGDTNMEVLRARGSNDSLNDRLDEFDKKQIVTTNSLSQKASINYVDAILMDIAKGGPKGPFMSIAALKSAAYPDGKSGTWLVFDSSYTDGAHSWMWDTTNSIWKDLGVYQSSGIADSSISSRKLMSSYTPTTKTQSNYSSTSTLTSIYIMSPVLLRGAIDVTFTSGAAAFGYFYVFSKRTGIDTFDVLQRAAVEVKEGENNISTGLVAEGNGNEYIGFWAIPMKFNAINGPGFYEVQSYAGTATPVNAYPILTTGVDFSVYISYTDIAVVTKTIKERQNLQEKINAVDNKFQYMLTDYVSETYPKDFDLYVTGGAYKLYIPVSVLKVGSVFVHHKTDRNETGYFYILEKSGSIFLVKKRVQVDLIAGANLIDMDYRSDGSGIEYVGFYAHNFYKTVGGTGMFESESSLYQEGQTFSAGVNPSGTSATFDFATYYEYRGNELGKDVVKLIAEVEDLKNNTVAGRISLNSFSMLQYSDVTDSLGFVGRWFDKTIDGVACKATINAGSEFYFKVKDSSEASINFKINSTLHTPYYAYSIDGETLIRQLITSPIITLPDEGEHIIRIVVDGLTESENKWDGENGVAIATVTTPTEGTITGVVPRNKLIEYIGDSITEGVRVLSATENNANGNSASGAFPFIASQLLNAVSYRVGFGATGATQSGSGGVPKCISYLDNMTLRKGAPYYEPGAVVINHGTNDSSATSAAFIIAYSEILDRLKIKYSGTPIFAMIPFNQQHAQDIRDCVKIRPYVTLVETAGWGISFSDNAHPDLAGGIIAGNKLSGVIEATLGKAFFL